MHHAGGKGCGQPFHCDWGPHLPGAGVGCAGGSHPVSRAGKAACSCQPQSGTAACPFAVWMYQYCRTMGHLQAVHLCLQEGGQAGHPRNATRRLRLMVGV